MNEHVKNVIIGQGLAGSTIAWRLHWSGQSVLLIDRNEPNTASRVAAGLITPFTGKRFTRSAEFDEYWTLAKKFYRLVEQQTGKSFFVESAMIRLVEDIEADRELVDRYREETGVEVPQWTGSLETGGRKQRGITMVPAGRLEVNGFLEATREYFADKNSYLNEDLDIARDVDIEGQIKIERLKVTADRMILCQGAEQKTLFPDVPNNTSRGDILNVRIRDYEREEVVHRSIWIAAEADGSQTVGSTYDWKNKKAEPSESGKQEILQKLVRLIDGPFSVEGHKAAVRPTMKDYEPVLGRHPKHKSVYVFNGLGSKGSLKAPGLAMELEAFLEDQAAVPKIRSYERLMSTKENRRPLTMLAQEAVADALAAGDTAIDATVGNGFDTCFLAKTVGKDGKVIGYDVQLQAIEATKERLKANGLNNVSLLKQSHADMRLVTSVGSVKAIMFNLGYLPGSDHQQTTTVESTVLAISAAVDLLAENGVLTVLAYRGHEGGPEEYAAVESLLKQYQQQLDLKVIESSPSKSTAPVLFVGRRREKEQQDRSDQGTNHSN